MLCRRWAVLLIGRYPARIYMGQIFARSSRTGGGTRTFEIFWILGICSKRCRAQVRKPINFSTSCGSSKFSGDEGKNEEGCSESISVIWDLRSQHNLSSLATFIMFRTLVIASIVLASAVAFSPASMIARRSATKISMSAEFLPGALAPLGYFDPLGFCAGKTEGEVKVKIYNTQ